MKPERAEKRNRIRTAITQCIRCFQGAVRNPPSSALFGINLLAITAWSVGSSLSAYSGELTWEGCFKNKETLERVLTAGVGTWSLGKGPFRPVDRLERPGEEITSAWESGDCLVDFKRVMRSEQFYDGPPIGRERPPEVDPSELAYLSKGDPTTAVRRAVVRIWPRFSDVGGATGFVGGQAGTGFVVKREATRAWVATARHVLLSSHGSQKASFLDLEFYLGNLPPGMRSGRITVNVDSEALEAVKVLIEYRINEVSQLLDRAKRNDNDLEAQKALICQVEPAPLCRVNPDAQKIHSVKISLQESLRQDEAKLKRIKWFLAQIAQANREESEDIVLFEVEGLPPDIQPLPLSMASPQGPLKVVGHPSNMPPWAVASFPLLKSTDKFLVLDGQLETGASGSPVLNATGQVVGLVYETTSYSGGSLSLVSAYRSGLIQRMIP
jgi:hypothetical protein